MWSVLLLHSAIALASPQWTPPPMRNLLAYPPDVALVHGRCGEPQVRTVFDPDKKGFRQEHELTWTELEVLTPIRGALADPLRVQLECDVGQQVLVAIQPDARPGHQGLYTRVDDSALLQESWDGGLVAQALVFIDEEGRLERYAKQPGMTSFRPPGDPPHTWSELVKAVHAQNPQRERGPRNPQPIGESAERLQNLVATHPSGDPWGVGELTWDVTEGLHRLRWTTRRSDVAARYLDAEVHGEKRPLNIALPDDHPLLPDSLLISGVRGDPCDDAVWCSLLAEFEDEELVRITLSLAPGSEEHDNRVGPATTSIARQMGLPEGWESAGQIKVARHVVDVAEQNASRPSGPYTWWSIRVSRRGWRP